MPSKSPSKKPQEKRTTSDGIPVDAGGGPTIDPTKNVLDLVLAAVQRQDDLREAEMRYAASQIAHVKELATLRDSYCQRLMDAEAKRIDAIRGVVSTSSATLAEQQRQLATEFSNRLALVEKAQYEGKGKQLVEDPMMMEFMADMKRMLQLQATGGGKSEGSVATWGYIAAGAGLLVSIISIAGALFAILNK